MPNATNKVKLAIGAVMLSGFAVAFNDSLAKFISDEISLWQLFFLRSLLGAGAFFLLLCAVADTISLMPRSFFWVTTRSWGYIITATFFYIALPQVKIALLTALLFTFPVFVLLLAPIFGGDKVNGKNCLAIALAMVGMLFIVRPTPNNFNWFALFGVASAVFYAITMLITRAKLTRENSKVVSLWQSVWYVIVGAIGLIVMQLWQPEFAADNHFYFGGWEWLTALQWGFIVVIAAAFLISIVAQIFAYQNAPSPIIATFDYSFLLSALFWGWLILSETPTYLDAIGIAIIATAGILIVRGKVT